MFKFPWKGSKGPKEHVDNAREYLMTISTENNTLNDKDSKASKAVEELSKHLSAIKQTLLGSGDNDPKKNDVHELAKEAYNTDFLLALIENIEHLEFEARKDVVQIVNNLLRLLISGRYTTVDYICKKPEFLKKLLLGYEKPEIALFCGNILRECFRHEILTKMILDSEDVYLFFTYVDLKNFEVASDAFTTFRELLSRHKSLSAEFFEKNYDKFFGTYETLLRSKNYATRRQSLKLLGEILLDRSNFSVMKKFIDKEDNLKLLMNLLLDKSKNIQFEAFHVFKVFVANPEKTQPIKDILKMNQKKLVKYLSKFHDDRAKEDEQFNEERALLISEISKL